jgi:hypothetical protein
MGVAVTGTSSLRPSGGHLSAFYEALYGRQHSILLVTTSEILFCATAAKAVFDGEREGTFDGIKIDLLAWLSQNRERLAAAGTILALRAEWSDFSDYACKLWQQVFHPFALGKLD